MKRILFTLLALLTMPMVLTRPGTTIRAALFGPSYIELLGRVESGRGGWPTGMENARVRFIRMKYDGAGWDDGMEPASRADLNFLDYFGNRTTFRTASQPEAHSMTLLAKYPKGDAPPLVYMTGNGTISASDSDVRAMREYLSGGGMLFADCGSPAWGTAFHAFIKRVFPGESLTKIPHNDVIFQEPFAFKDGAPPVHRHSGTDALGIKYKGRWAVFYHPGKLTDAWKVNSGGLTTKDTEGTLEMGVNLIYYAYSRYVEITRKYRGHDGGAAYRPRNEGRTRADSRWVRYSLESIGAFEQTTPEDRTLQLVRKLVKQDSDLLDAMNRLEEVPFRVSAVCESLMQAVIDKTRALVFDIPEGRTLVLIFDVEARAMRDPLTCKLQDSFLLTLQGTKVNVLLDVIPKAGPPQAADFSRVLTWCESSFLLLDKERLKEMLKQESAESTQAPITPVVSRPVDLPRMQEIPRNPDDIPPDSAADLGGAWGENLSRETESRLNSISPLVFTNR